LAIYIRKVVMLGDPAVGKTSLVHKYVHNMFDDKYLSTIGARPVKKVIEMGSDTVILIIWDIAGHSHNLHPAYYLGAKGALMVCDLTRRSTADSIESWLSSLQSKAGEIPVFVLGNKSDLANKELSMGDLDILGYDTFPTSAKTGENVDKAFTKLAEVILNGGNE
jgi:small GTP-binding protein